MESICNSAAEWLEYAIDTDMVAPDGVDYIKAAMVYCRRANTFSDLNDIFNEYVSGVIVDWLFIYKGTKVSREDVALYVNNKAEEVIAEVTLK